MLVFMFFHSGFIPAIGDFLGDLIGGGGPTGPIGPPPPPSIVPPSSGCPPGTAWRGFPWQSNVCDPIGVVPGGPPEFNPTPGGGVPCFPPWKRDPLTGQCSLFLGEVPGPDPSPVNGVAPGASGSRIHGEFFHRDHPPKRVSVSVRRCGPGFVLGKDRWCHPNSLPNKERLYPKPTPPLGTSAQMKAITVAGQFARRLKTKKKVLKKLSTLLVS